MSCTIAVDIDECLMESDSCQSDENCVNNLGSFSCSLPEIPSPPSLPTSPPTTAVEPTTNHEEPSVTPSVDGSIVPPLPVLCESSQLT